jgi:DNA repair protein RadC
MQQLTLPGFERPSKKTFKAQRFRAVYVRENDDLQRITVDTVDSAVALASQYLSSSPIEQLLTIALDNSLQLMGFEVITGATNQCRIEPSAIYRFLLCSYASSWMIAHNHPGGTSVPSQADWNITLKLHRIGKEMGLPLHDHILIPEGGQAVSMRNLAKWPS